MSAPTDAATGRRSRADGRAALGWRMQLVRAAIWEGAATGDAYLRLLCDADDDPDPALRDLVAAGPVHRSLADNTVVLDPDVGRAALADARLGTRTADGGRAHLQVLDLPGAHVDTPEPAGSPWPLPAADRLDGVVRRAVGEWRGARGPAGADLVGLAREVAVRVVADVTGTSPGVLGLLWPRLATALDALLSPQRLDDAWELRRAVPMLRLLLREAGTDPEEEAVRVGATVVWASVLETAVLTAVGAAAADAATWSRCAAEPDAPSDVAAQVTARAFVDRPPVRLVARVAQEDLEVGGLPVAAGEQVVVVDAGGWPACGLMTAAGGAHAAAAGLVAPVAAATLRALTPLVDPGRVGAPVRARRSPVVGRVVQLPLRRADACG